MRVLHVDDEEGWRYVITDVMKRNGHELVSCSTLSEAQQQLAEASPFDLIICDGTLGDWQKNEGNGLRWAEQLHAQGKNVVVLSGHAETSIPYIRKRFFEEEKILELLK